MAHTISESKRRSRVLDTPIAQVGKPGWSFLTACGFCKRDRVTIPIMTLARHCGDATTIAQVLNRLRCGTCDRVPNFVRLDAADHGKFSMILRGPLAF